MNIEQMNRIRRVAGLPDLSRDERVRIEEKYVKKAAKDKSLLTEAANNRPSSKVLSDIAKQHLHVRSLSKTGDDDKDYHDCPCWAIESALKAAFKAGQQSAKKSDVKESVEDKESKKEAAKGGTKKPDYDPKGGAKHPKDGKDAANDKDNSKVEEGKKADKDYDKDGEVESSTSEYKGSRNKAIKKALKKDKKDIKEMHYEDEENYNSSYKKGQLVKHNGSLKIVHVPDAKADYVGLIPANLQDASEEEKDGAVDLAKTSECDPASDADYEDCEMAMSMEGVTKLSKNYMNQDKGPAYQSGGSGYGEKPDNAYTKVVHNNSNVPGGNKTVEKYPGSGAKDKNELSLACKTTVHKDDSEGYGHEKTKKMANKDLKKISEAKDATVWGKDYGRDDQRIDRDESPDKLAIADPNAKDKVPVPGNIKTALQTEINQLREEADKVHVRDPYGSDFYRNTADAFDNLLGHLKEGTRRSIQLAQIDLNRVMSPMIERIPSEVYMFIVRGGKPAALTELFKEVKVKREKGADLSKEDYTK